MDFLRRGRFIQNRVNPYVSPPKAFLPLVVEQIRSQFGCKDVYTSVDDKNYHAKHLYTSFGFERTEEMDGEERVYVLRGE